MKFDVLTLFPKMFDCVMFDSILGRAIKNKLFELNIHNIRDYTLDKHKRVDDYPYGGGEGMLMQVEPILRCYNQTKSENSHLIYMSPKGSVFNQEKAKELLKYENISILCGHYEGIDQRVVDLLKPEEISIGDYVLTGGEIGAMAVIDSVSRLIPGVLGSEEGFIKESHYNGLLEYPQYTRPFEYEGICVPEVLISGHDKNIKNYQYEMSLKETKEKRPDMFLKYTQNIDLTKLDKDEKKILSKIIQD